MVDVNEDAMAVTMKIRRETRVANERAAAERAAFGQGELQLPPPVPSADGQIHVRAAPKETIAVPVQAPVRPVDADTAYRRARLGVVAVIVLVLLLVWIMQSRRR